MPQILRAPRAFNVRTSIFLAALFMGSALAQPITMFPYSENFDSFAAGTGLANGWTNPVGTGDQRDWTADCCGTGSGATGPLNDATTWPSGPGNYLYYETSSPVGTGDEAWLISPDFDITGTPNLGIEFAYHMFGATMGDLNVEVWDGLTYTTELTLSGAQQAAQGDPFIVAAPISLAAYTGVIHVRFRINRGTSFTGDGAIDDFRVFDASAPSCTMVSLDTPVTGCGLSAAEVVTVTVHNNSTLPAMSVPVSFEITGAFPQGPVVEMVPMIPAGGDVQYAFTATADCSMGGSYDFTITISQPGDIDPSDDTQMLSVFNAGPVPALVLPISEDWEAGMGTWTLTGTSSWELGIPAGATIIGTPGGVGVNSWMTGLAAQYGPAEDGAVQSAPLSLCGFIQPEVSLDIWWNAENSWDGAVLQVSYDSGVTWENVGAFGDPNNWFTDDTINGNPGGQQEGWTGRDSSGNGSGGWVRASSTDLLPIPAQLRMAFGSDTSVYDDGIAFDNLLIREFGLQTTLDVGAFQPMQPVMANNNDTGVVVMAADITPDVGDDLLQGFDLIASGAGDDFTDILNVSVVLEDAATVNGVVDGMDTVIFSGTYPADDGTINVVLTPGAGLIRMASGTNSFLVVYDLSGTASGAMPPTDYTVTLDNIQVAGDVMVPVAPPSGTVMVDACPTTLCGDCNLDGMISILDALNAAQHAAGLITLMGPAFSNCNVEGLIEPDPMASVTVLDALILAQFAAGLPVTLICC